MYFLVNFNVFFLNKKVHLLLNELYKRSYCLYVISITVSLLLINPPIHKSDSFLTVVSLQGTETAFIDFDFFSFHKQRPRWFHLAVMPINIA